MKNHQIDMTRGPIFAKLIRFTIPVLLTNFLQQLYNVADTVVVGKFDGTVALAAVGSTGTLTNTFLLMFTGIATGVGVVVAQCIGAELPERKKRASETAILTALVSGIALAVLGYFTARPLLRFMACPEDVLDAATLYVRLYLGGSPALLLYNFGSNILRAHGDTKRPMFILTLAGIINILLNILLVVVFRLGVLGVGVATIASETVTAVCVLWILYHPSGEYRLSLTHMSFDKKELGAILKVGVPVGINGLLFNVTNIFIQREVNAFGGYAMAGNAAASGLDKFTHVGMTAFEQAAVCFAGQNVGAKKYRRLDTILWQSILSSAVFTLALSTVFVAFHEPLLDLFIRDGSGDREAIIAAALPKLVMVGVGYIICGTEEILSCTLKAMNKSAITVMVNLVSVTAVRLLWVFLVFYNARDLWVLYTGYAVSWTVSSAAQFILYRHYRRHAFSNEAQDAAAAEETGAPA